MDKELETQGYYPRSVAKDDKQAKQPAATRRSRHFTKSCSYAEDTEDSQLEALWQVLLFLWREHRKQGGSNQHKPSREKVLSSLRAALGEISSGDCQATAVFNAEEPTEATPASSTAPAAKDTLVKDKETKDRKKDKKGKKTKDKKDKKDKKTKDKTSKAASKKRKRSSSSEVPSLESTSD